MPRPGAQQREAAALAGQGNSSLTSAGLKRDEAPRGTGTGLRLPAVVSVKASVSRGLPGLRKRQTAMSTWPNMGTVPCGRRQRLLNSQEVGVCLRRYATNPRPKPGAIAATGGEPTFSTRPSAL
jgi:hypothetical protein